MNESFKDKLSSLGSNTTVEKLGLIWMLNSLLGVVHVNTDASGY